MLHIHCIGLDITMDYELLTALRVSFIRVLKFVKIPAEFAMIKL